jgi:gliding motility-associated-like protein
MKSLKITFLPLFIFCLIATNGFGQMVGGNAFLMGVNQEIGINPLGFEGTTTGSIPAPFPTHYRGFTSRLAFLSNADLSSPWETSNYMGDVIMPGSPEGRFGMEVDGVTVWNSSNDWDPAGITSFGLSNYTIYGRCKSVDWDGIYAGIDIHMTYIMDTTKTYYRVVVTLTNTNPVAKNNVFFYKSLDPDNNMDVSWGFETTNIVESNPTPFCPKSLVSALSVDPFGAGDSDAYFALGGIGADIRVARGSFFVEDGSDVFDGTGPMIGVIGSTAYSDEAIAICHKDATLAAGASSQFEFIVVMAEAELEEALLAQYYLDYDGADPYALCTEEVEPDTLYADCAGPTTMTITGPMLGSYTWTWTNALTGEIVGTGPEIEVTPAGTTHYICTGEPIGGCFILDIVREVVVVSTGIGPDMIIEPIAPLCGTFDLADLVITDAAGIPGTFIEYYFESPDSIDDPTEIWPGGPVGPGDDIYVMMGDAAGGCYDLQLLDIPFIIVSAGLDSVGHLLCNSGVLDVDFNSFLVDTALLIDGGIWEEITPTGGAFDALTGIFDPTGVPAGDYTIRYIALGGVLCENDTSIHTITVYDQPTAGADNTGEICNETGLTFDLNTLLVGHDPGGTWSEVTATGGAFNPLTGILTVGGGLVAGDYDFEYTLVGTDPCIDDVASFTISVNAAPALNAGPDQSICIGDETSVNAVGDPATYIWTPGGIFNGVPFTPGLGTLTYTVVATDANGCVNTDELEITVHPLPIISFTATDLEGCTPFNTEFTVVSDIAIASTDWFFGDGDIATGITFPTISHTYLFGGVYDVRATVTDIYGCVSSIEYNDYITVETQPIAAFQMSPNSVYSNDTEVNFNNQSLYATDYIWNFGDASALSNEVNPMHNFPEIGDVFYPVTLIASNYLGCADTVTQFLNVKSIIIFYIPNTFTPDNDEYNNVFKPVFESGYDPYDFHMAIYNRYGEMIFESYDVNGAWDGTYGTRELVQDGVYTWQIDFKEKYTDKRHTHSGHVTILR